MVWNLIAVAVIFVVSFLLTVLLAPKPKIENARPSGLDDLRLPQASYGAPVGLLLGKTRQRGPNTLWYGDLQTRALTKKVKTGLWSSKTQVTGYAYSIGADLGLCLGPGVTLHRIWSDKKEVWSGAATGDGVAININDPGLYGGPEQGGGLVGTFRFYSGDFSQSRNAYLQQFLGSDMPAQVGVAHLVFEGVEIGNSPQLRPFSFELSRYTNGLGLDPGTLIINEDLNPAELIYQVLTASWGGVSIPTADIESSSFIAAAATLAAEQNGMSVIINKSNTAKDVLGEALRQIDGILYQDPTTSKIVLKLIRSDWDINTLPVFDESNIVTVKGFSRSSWDQTINRVRVNYINRADKYETGTAMVEDLANITTQGKVKPVTYSFPGVTNGSLATRIANRELTQLGVPLFKVTFEANREALDLRPGDTFVFKWADYGITQVVMRVQRFNQGELLDGRIVIEALEDEYATDLTVYAPPPANAFVPPVTTPTAVTQARLLELPNWLVRQQGEVAQPSTTNRGLALGLVRQPNSAQLGWRGSWSQNSWVTSQELADFGTVFTNTAILDATIDQTAGFVAGFAPTVRIREIRPNTSWLSSTSAALIRSEGRNMILIDNELLAFEGVVNNGDGTWNLTNVWRGLLDSPVEAHTAGAVIYHVSGVDGLTRDLIDASVAVSARFWSSAVSGESAQYEISATPNRRFERPLPPDNLRIGGSRTVNGPSVFEGDVLSVAWNQRNRLATGIALETDGTETPEAGTTYNLYLFINDIQRASVTGVSGTSATLGVPSGFSGPGQVRIETVQGGLTSLWRAFHNVQVQAGNFFITDTRHFDTYQMLTPRGVWGLRKRISAYSGPLVRIRDTSDNSEQDVGFDGDGELATFTVVGEARVVRLYDQTGNANHLQQSTASAQPLLSLTGGVNGRPCIDFAGGNRVLKGAIQGSDSSPIPILQPNPILLAGVTRPSGTAVQSIIQVPNAMGSWVSPFGRLRLYATNTTGRFGANSDGTQGNMSSYGDLVGFHSLMLNFGQKTPGSTVYYNGTMALETLHSFDGTVNYPNTVTLTVGENESGTEDYTGLLSELAIISGATDRNNYEPALLTELQRGAVLPHQPHRYWRAVFDAVSGTASNLSIARFQMSETMGGADIATGGTASASTTFSGTSAANAFDTDPATFWAANVTSLGSWLAYDLGAGNEKAVREVAFTIRNDGTNWVDRSPMAGRIQWSDDGANWFTEFFFATSVNWSWAGQTRRFRHPAVLNANLATPRRYWRVRTTDTHISGDYFGISELQMRRRSGLADITFGKTATASASGGGAPANAIDDNDSTFWSTGATGLISGSHWYRVDFGTDESINEVSLRVRGDSFREDPVTLFIESSPDDVNWTTVWSESALPTWSAGETRVFTR